MALLSGSRLEFGHSPPSCGLILYRSPVVGTTIRGLKRAHTVDQTISIFHHIFGSPVRANEHENNM